MDSDERCDWRVILVENGSTDHSESVIRDICQADERFECLKLARNFGTEGGILAGLSIANGDAAVTMQADLEDPPELIPKMITEWQRGYSYVYGRVLRRGHLPRWRKLGTKIYYRLANWLTEGAVIPNASDFRLLDRQLYLLVVSIQEQNLFLRGLVNWAGLPSSGVEFERDARFAGQTKFDVRKVVLFAIRGILAQSSKPLRLVTTFGVTLSALSMLSIVILAFRAFFLSVPFAGFGTIVGLQFLFFGLTVVILGIVAEYIALTYNEVRPRPHFIIHRDDSSDN
jgi:dolichol-phosphate mannosyltransferase